VGRENKEESLGEKRGNGKLHGGEGMDDSFIYSVKCEIYIETDV